MENKLSKGLNKNKILVGGKAEMAADKFIFMNVIDEILERAKTEEDIKSLTKQMIEMIKAKESMHIQYLKAGILK